jgi:hypothetical protein
MLLEFYRERQATAIDNARHGRQVDVWRAYVEKGGVLELLYA